MIRDIIGALRAPSRHLDRTHLRTDRDTRVKRIRTSLQRNAMTAFRHRYNFGRAGIEIELDVVHGRSASTVRYPLGMVTYDEAQAVAGRVLQADSK